MAIQSMHGELKPVSGHAYDYGDELMTVRDVAQYLRLKPKGIYPLVERRAIPFVRVSNRLRFLRADVVAWLEENRVPASE